MHSSISLNRYPPKETLKPLNVAIVGAGIGGLTTAIALRRQGHNVTLYEASTSHNEVGAAIHLTPNSNGILRRYGIFAEKFGAVKCTTWSGGNGSGEITRRIDLGKTNEMWQHPWLLVHRVHLHDRLKRIAISKGAVLKNSAKVLSADASAGTITLEDGTTVSADVVIGADGIYSKTRTFVSCKPNQLFSSGKSAFRFLISRKDAQADPLCAKYVSTNGELCILEEPDRRIVIYPINNNEILNFVCIHPETESQVDGTDWSHKADVAQMLKIYQYFDEGILALLRKATNLKLWMLLDMDFLDNWTEDRLALIGDAAHPFLPYQAQGGGMAIEDAATLGVILPLGTLAEEVPERLRLYQKIRKARVEKIQEYTRQAGLGIKEGTTPIDMISYMTYNFGHDEIDNSTKQFHLWWQAKHPSLSSHLPKGFGHILKNPGPSLPHHSLTASIKFKTSRTFLQNLLPTDSFRIKSPGTVALATFSVSTLGVAPSIGGQEFYSHFGLYIHDVAYTKKDGSSIEGTYLPLLLENHLADHMRYETGELGVPRMACQINIIDDSSKGSGGFKMQASWGGNQFIELDLGDLKSESDFSGVEAEQEMSNLAYRCVPKVGPENGGLADVEYAVVIPNDMVPESVDSVKTSSDAEIKFEPLDEERLPTSLHHVVWTLAEVPIYEILEAKVVTGTGVPAVLGARRIEE